MAEEVEQADGDQQEGGQLELLHELFYQAGGGLMQVIKLLGGEEAHASTVLGTLSCCVELNEWP